MPQPRRDTVTATRTSPAWALHRCISHGPRKGRRKDAGKWQEAAPESTAPEQLGSGEKQAGVSMAGSEYQARTDLRHSRPRVTETSGIL